MSIQAGAQTGTGPLLASDDSGASPPVRYSKGKLVFGADGTFTDVSLTNGLPVQPATASAWVLGAGAAAIGSVTVTSLVPGVAATSLGKAEDAAHASGDTGVFVLAVRNDTPGALAGADGDYAPIQVNAAGAVRVDGSQVTQPISNSFLTSMAAEYAANAVVPIGGVVNPGNTPNTVPWLVSQRPATSGGLSVSRLIAAAGANQDATVAKASAGQVYGWYITNINAAVAYVKIYNLASGATSGGTPILTIAVPGNAAGAGTNIEFANGIACSTGISFRITTGKADNDANAVAAGDVIVNLLYK